VKGADLISQYDFIIFDCDGVILDSNSEKERLLVSLASEVSPEARSVMLRSLCENQGQSRYSHFNFLLDNINPMIHEGLSVQSLLDRFSLMCVKFLCQCDMVETLPKLKLENPLSSWCVVSSSDEEELRFVFKERRIDHFFDAGIFGSPRTKNQVVEDLAIGAHSVLVIGDGVKDFELAQNFGFDMLFMEQWSSLEDPHLYCKKYKIPSTKSLQSIFFDEVNFNNNESYLKHLN
jgi:phosphoglycolate phosphatase-like HAD superfamily hydrolase